MSLGQVRLGLVGLGKKDNCFLFEKLNLKLPHCPRKRYAYGKKVQIMLCLCPTCLWFLSWKVMLSFIM
jgi:hypothetical protein